MKYVCVLKRGKQSVKWDATIRILAKKDSYYEAVVEGRGSRFYLVAGSYSHGKYVCIPELDIGCGTADFWDVFWNTEHLSRQVDKVDAVTIANGLARIEEACRESARSVATEA